MKSRRFLLSRARMLSFLDELKTTSGEAVSQHIPPGISLSDLDAWLYKFPHTPDNDVASLIICSKTGAVLFWGSSRKCLVLPPFPVKDKYISQGYDIEPLQSMLKRDAVIALVLIRLGSYAIGLIQGEKIMASKVGTGLVHGRHRQGGSSAHRFERHRDKQIEYFLTRVCQHAREQLDPYVKIVEYIVYGGARTTILSLQKQCPFLGAFDDRTLPPLLTIAEPRQVVLEAAISQVWSSTVIEWYDSET